MSKPMPPVSGSGPSKVQRIFAGAFADGLVEAFDESEAPDTVDVLLGVDVAGAVA